LYPSAEVAHHKIELQPAMQLKARIAQVKTVSKGFKVSYGQTYTTPSATRLATVPIGYADGYSRHLSSSGVMLVKGMRAPVVGQVCMDQSIIDVGHIEGVHCGDEVVIIGHQNGAVLTAEEMALQLGTINYEIVATVMARVPRIYLGAS
jgi:alanine racemase